MTTHSQTPSARHGTVALTAITLLAFDLGAQLRLDELRPKNPLLRRVGAHAAPAFGDLDGDGRPDLAFGVGNILRVFRGMPDARFSEVPSPAFFPFNGVSVISFGDLEGDGDLDVYVSDRDTIQLLRNNGGFAFTNVTATSLTINRTWPNGLLPRDVDGDGDVDLLGPTSFLNIPNVLWLNDGTGRLVDVVATHMPPGIVPTAAACFADVDGDNDPDIFLAAAGLKLLRNDGTGRFTDVTAATLPVQSAPLRAVTAADVDRDGDVDVLFGAATGNAGLFLNNGSGTFTDGTAGRLPPFTALRVQCADLDGDGAQDIIAEQENYFAGGVRNAIVVLRNDGTGVFADTTASWLVPGTSLPTGIAIADIDGDGARDMYMTRFFATDGLYLSQGGGRLVDVWAGKVPEVTARLSNGICSAMADFDGDADPDLCVGDSGGLNLWRNDGRGRYDDQSARQASAFRSTIARDVAAGDVDGDGDADLATAPSGLWRNDGTGVFSDASSRLPAVGVGDVVDVADADADGDLDLLVGTNVRGQTPVLWRNDGTGTFVAAAALPANPQWLLDARFVDVERDGDQDIVVLNRQGVAVGSLGQNLLFLNDGTGTFQDVTATHLPVRGAWHMALQLGDLDRDGDTDMVVGTTRDFGGAYACCNDGSGRFTLAPSSYLPAHPDDHHTMHLFDIDQDGDPDLVAASHNFSSLRASYFYENAGASFVRATNLIDAAHCGQAFASGDIDGDRDIDLFVTSVNYAAPSFEGRNRVLTNCRRQLEVHTLAFPGGSLELSHYARKDSAVGDHSALAMLSAAMLPVPVPLPFGRLFIDPGTMVMLPAIAVPALTGLQVQALPVPPNAGLSRQAVHLQAVSFANADPVGTLSLTNAVSETLR